MFDYNFAIQGVNTRVRVSRTSDDAPTAVLLHGFPESWYAWRHVIPALHAAGWRCAALDLRGFGLSEKPRDPAAYRVDILANDVIGVLDKLKIQRAAVIGHDLGGAIAWRTAMDHPGRVSHLVAVCAPHPSTGRPTLSPMPGAGALRLFPLFMEANLWWANYRLLSRGLQSHVKPGALSDADLAAYRDAWYREGAVGAMLRHYRAPDAPKAAGPVSAPTLIVWGEGDKWAPASLAETSAAQVPGARIVRLPTGHFPHLDAPDQLSSALVGFLGPHVHHAEWRPPQW
jgi:pimeloyl-ACP methyl ester carboxylesterase